MKKNPYIGSAFESVFDELGEREEFELFAQKQQLAQELKDRMHQKKLSRSALAKRMKAEKEEVESLLEARSEGISYDKALRAFQAVGLSLHAT